MISEDEKTLKERMRYILHNKRWTISKLSHNDTERARFGRQINGDAAVPFSTIVLFLSKFPDVSADWLIMGEGDMLKSKRSGTSYGTMNHVSDSRARGSINVGTTTIPDSVQKLLDEKNARIAELEKDKDLLQTILASMTKK